MCCNVDVKSLTFSSLLLWEADVTLFTLFTLSWAKFWALKMGIKSLWLIAKMAIVAALRSRDEFNFLSLPLAVYQNTLLSLDDNQGLGVNVRSLNGDKSWEIFRTLRLSFPCFEWRVESEMCFWLNAKSSSNKIDLRLVKSD